MYKPNLTNNQSWAIWEILLTKHHPNDWNKLLPSATHEVSLQFNVTPTVIYDLFKWRQESLVARNVVADVSRRKHGQVGRKKQLLDLEAMKAIPLMQRQNVWSLAVHLHTNKSKIHCLIREDKFIKPHSSSIKPYLIEDYKIGRVQYCMSHFDQARQFDFIMNEIYLDKKCTIRNPRFR